MGCKREKNIGFAALLNIIFTIIEIVGGILTNSLALIADALHDFGDSIALMISWIAEKKAKRKADRKRTFGYQRISLFASLFAAFVLFVGSLVVLAKAIPRLINPEHVDAEGVVLIAVIGIIINSIGFYKLYKGKSQNEKILSLHLLEDMLGWIALLIGAIVMSFTDLHIIDPLLTIGFTLFVLYGVIKNLRESFNILMEGVPSHINLEEIEEKIKSIEGIVDVHDIHLWSLEGETLLLTAHLRIKNIEKEKEVKRKVREYLKEKGIVHSTLEVEEECNEGKCTF